MPNYQGKSYPGTFPLNLFDELGYIEGGGITDIPAYGPKNSVPQKPKGWTPPKKDLIYEKPVNAVVTATSLNLRESFSTSSPVIASIKQGTKLKVEPIKEPKGISWAKTTYNGKTGFVHMNYLEIEKPDVKYNKGDVNGDGKIDGFDMMEIKRHYLKIKQLSGERFKAADINNNGVVDGFDMMEIKRHYLGIKKIKG